MDKLFYNPKGDNIFEFSFMNDFTTVVLAEEEYGIDISKLKYENIDDFYCFGEKKAYTQEELFKRFNIQAI
jgi:hypothetical protein